MNNVLMNGAPLNGSSELLPPANLGSFRKTVRLATGLAVVGAEVTVTKADGAAVALWDGDQDPKVLKQPVLTDGTGTFEFYAEYGSYNITVTSDEGIKTLEDQYIGPSVEYVDGRVSKVDADLRGLVSDEVVALNGRIDSVEQPVGSVSMFVDGASPEGWARTGSSIQESEAPVLAPLLPEFAPRYNPDGAGAIISFNAPIPSSPGSFLTAGDGFGFQLFVPGNQFGILALAFSVEPAPSSLDVLWTPNMTAPPYEFGATDFADWIGEVGASTSRFIPYLNGTAPHFGLAYLDPDATASGMLGILPSKSFPTEEAASPADAPIESSLMALTPRLAGEGSLHSNTLMTATYATVDPAASETVIHANLVTYASEASPVTRTHRIAAAEAPKHVAVAAHSFTEGVMVVTPKTGDPTIYFYSGSDGTGSNSFRTLSIAAGGVIGISQQGEHIVSPGNTLGEANMATINPTTSNIGLIGFSNPLDLAGNVPEAITEWIDAFIVAGVDPGLGSETVLLVAVHVATATSEYLVIFFRQKNGGYAHSETIEFGVDSVYIDAVNANAVIQSASRGSRYVAAGGFEIPTLTLFVDLPTEGGTQATPILYAPVQTLPGDGEIILPEYPSAIDAQSLIKPYIKYK